MMHNQIIEAMGRKVVYQEVLCPYCDSMVETVMQNPICSTCNQRFLMEDGRPVAYYDIDQRMAHYPTSRAFLKEAVSDVARGKKGWKYVVSAYRSPEDINTFDIYWSIDGAKDLFKNTEKVDLMGASKEAMLGDKTNKTDFSYSPDMEAMRSIKDIKRVMKKYHLEGEGYSVSSFVISSDGTKVYSGAEPTVFSTASAKPFYTSIAKCVQMQAELKTKYKPEDYPAGSALQMAINNFIRDNPLILSYTKDNNKPHQMGYLSELAPQNKA